MRKVLLIVSIVVVGLALATPARASALASNARGIHGRVITPEPATCEKKLNGTLIATGGPSTVYSPPRTTANVRMRSFKATTSRSSYSRWSGWKRVSPGRPAVFSAGTASDLHWRNSFTLGYEVQFHRPRGGYLGNVVLVYTRYNYRGAGNIGPRGPFASCSGQFGG